MADVNIVLDTDAAIVLRECLSRWDCSDHPVNLVSSGEVFAMAEILRQLDDTLIEPLCFEYPSILADAVEALERRAAISST